MITPNLTQIPETSGIYKFLNNQKIPIYIGKSINLKKRVASYFRNSGQSARIQMMVRQIDDIIIETTPSELLALLYEDYLIKKHLPQYNVRQKQFFKYTYLVLTEEKFPRLKMINDPQEYKGNNLFGPFKNEYFVDHLKRLLCQHFHLCLCPNLKLASRCLYHQLQFCSGPDLQKVSELEYKEMITKAVEFIKGNDDSVCQKLQTRLDHLVAGWKFEQAKKIRESYLFCLRFVKRQKFIYMFTNNCVLIYEKAGQDYFTYIFNRGILVKTYPRKFSKKDMLGLLKKYESQSLVDEDRRFILDKAEIAYEWLHQDTKNRHYLTREKNL